MINYRGKLRKMLSGYQGRPFVVRYWDGASEQFGQGGPGFALYFKTKESLRRSLLETSLGFGEAYARGAAKTLTMAELKRSIRRRS